MIHPEDELSQEQHRHANDQYHNQETENKDKPGRNVKNEKLNDSLKDQGMDEEQARGIANTPDAGQTAEDAHVYENMPMEELYEEAKKAGIDGYYEMRKNDIVMALKQERSGD